MSAEFRIPAWRDLSAERRELALRLSLGLAQGAALGGLVHSNRTAWARGGGLWEVLFVVALYLPLIPLAAIGRMRRRPLLVWTLAAGALLALLGAYDDWRRIAPEAQPDLARGPSGALLLCAAAALYIVHHLLESALAVRRLRAPYPAYVEAAWRHAFQLLMALAFTGVLWGVLAVASALFGVIGLKSVATGLLSPWLAWPALGAGFAAAVHQTDVRPGMIEGVRRLGLTLLSWLLLLATALAAAFLPALLATGLKPLWSTQRASGLLLAAAVGLVVLVNAAYQDGEDASARSPAALRWAGRLAALLIGPFVALAWVGLWLRVAQHGLTPARVSGLAVAVVAALYAAGYLWAASRTRPWMKPLETVNLVGAGVVALVLLAVVSPVADPARLSVDDQLARLRSGLTPPRAFDFDALQFRSARFGREATAALARSPDPPTADGARTAQRRSYPGGESLEPPHGRPFANARLHPAGAVLPADFRAKDWSADGVGVRYDAAACLVSDVPCDVFILDLNRDARPEVVVLAPDQASPTVFARAPTGAWMRAGGYEGPYDPPGVREAIVTGDVHPKPQPLPDLQVGPQLYRYRSSDDYAASLRAAPSRSR